LRDYSKMKIKLVKIQDLRDMPRNGAVNVDINAFFKLLLAEETNRFQRIDQMANIVMSNPVTYEQVIRHFFGRVFREVRGQ